MDSGSARLLRISDALFRLQRESHQAANSRQERRHQYQLALPRPEPDAEHVSDTSDSGPPRSDDHDSSSMESTCF